MSIRGSEAGSVPAIPDRGSSDIDNSGSIRLSFVEKELVLMGWVLDLKSTSGLVMELLSSMSMLLLLRRRGFGETVEKRRKKKFASLAIFLLNLDLMIFVKAKE